VSQNEDKKKWGKPPKQPFKKDIEKKPTTSAKETIWISKIKKPPTPRKFSPREDQGKGGDRLGIKKEGRST